MYMLGHRLLARPAVPAALLAVILLVTAAPALAEPAGEPEVPPTAYQATGPAIEGGSSIAQAPTVAPGLHRDSFAVGSEELGTDGTAKYYRIAVEDGQRVHAAATIAAPPHAHGLPKEGAGTIDLGISFVTASGADCNGTSPTDVGETTPADGPLTTVRVSGEVGPETCAGTELFLRITRMGDYLAGTPLPVEVQIAIEPAGIQGGGPSVTEPVEDGGASPVAPEDPDPLELGRSLTAARQLDAGSYVIELVPGEVGYVALTVGEGQRLRWRTEVVSEPGEEPGRFVLLTQNAVRDLVTVDGGLTAVGMRGTVAGGGMAAPVAVGNRTSDSPSVRSAWLPGTYTVMVQRLQRPEGAPAGGTDPVRMILTLEVEGEATGDGQDVLELGELPSGSSGGVLGAISALGAGQWVLLAAAGLLAVVGMLTGVAGVVLLGVRRR